VPTKSEDIKVGDLIRIKDG